MKTGMFGSAVCGLLCFSFISVYGGMLNKPAAGNLKTVALISAYMNRDFYNVAVPKSSVELNIFGKKKDNKDQIDNSHDKEYEALINYGINAYTGRLEGVGDMKWLPAAEVLENGAYKKFMESSSGNEASSGLLKTMSNLKELEWFTAPNMFRVPAESVAIKGKFISIGGAKDQRVEMAGLCKELKVDAVAVIEFDMAYTKLIEDADMISGIPAKPSVSVALVIVNKDGEVAVNSGLIEKGQGRRFEGKRVNMLEQNRVLFNDKSIGSYQTAIDKSADDLKIRLSKEFSKMK